MKNKIVKLLSGFMLVCMFLLPFSSVHAADYEITFKAGSHGDVNGQEEVSYHLSTNDVFPDEPEIQVEDGYVFTGWNKELPPVGSKIEGKAVYVAKYGVLINGVPYTVRYVDENHIDITTAKTMLGEQGTSITIRAKNIPGYTYQQAEQTFTLDETKEIFFVYTLTNPDEVIPYNPDSSENQGAASQLLQNGNTAGQDGTINEDQANQRSGNGQSENESETVDENQTPLFGGNNAIGNFMIVGGIVALAAVVAALIFLYFKKKKRETAETVK